MMTDVFRLSLHNTHGCIYYYYYIALWLWDVITPMYMYISLLDLLSIYHHSIITPISSLVTHFHIANPQHRTASKLAL